MSAISPYFFLLHSTIIHHSIFINIPALFIAILNNYTNISLFLFSFAFLSCAVFKYFFLIFIFFIFFFLFLVLFFRFRGACIRGRCRQYCLTFYHVIFYSKVYNIYNVFCIMFWNIIYYNKLRNVLYCITFQIFNIWLHILLIFFCKKLTKYV